jgi:hypothetical protein
MQSRSFYQDYLDRRCDELGISDRVSDIAHAIAVCLDAGAMTLQQVLIAVNGAHNARELSHRLEALAIYAQDHSPSPVVADAEPQVIGIYSTAAGQRNALVCHNDQYYVIREGGAQ